MHADTSSWPTEAELNWTPRQLEVIQLIAKGYTNVQIAERLDISLAGAKWHVSEVLSKLGVESREAIPDYWRSRRSALARFRRHFALGVGLPSAKVALGTAAVASAGLTATAILVQGGSSSAPEIDLVRQDGRSDEERAIEAAREYLVDLAQVTRFSFETLDPHDVDQFRLESIESVIANGQVAYEVKFRAPSGLLAGSTDGLRFAAVVTAADGLLVERQFYKVPLPTADTARVSFSGPFYLAFQVQDDFGAPWDILVGRGAGGWNMGVTTSTDGPAAILVTGYGDEEPTNMGVSFSQTLSHGRVPDDVVMVRVTLQDGSVVTATMGVPPAGVGPGGKLFALSTDGVWPVLFEALDDDGTVLHKYVTGPPPQTTLIPPPGSLP